MPELAVVVAGLAGPAAALALGTNLAAQETRIRTTPPRAEIPSGRMSEAERGRRTMIGYAECVIKLNRRRAMDALALFPTSAKSNEALTRLAVDRCMGMGEMRFQPRLFRGTLYTVLYRERYAAPPPLPEVPPDYAAGAPEPLGQWAQNEIALLRFADCVVRRAPETVHSLLTAPVESERERAAVAALKPHMNPCMKEGLQVTFNKSSLGGLLAEAMYRSLTQGEAAPAAARSH